MSTTIRAGLPTMSDCLGMGASFRIGIGQPA
jgi:hypothetical protein